MTNTLSPYFSDEELETQLRLQFEEEDMFTIEFKSFFNQIEDVGDCFQLRFRNRLFNIDKVTGDVTQVIK